MLTEAQKQEIVTRTKKRQPIKVIGYEMGIPGATVSSYIRRKHPSLLRWSQEIRTASISFYTKKIAKALNVSETIASVIYETMYDRFQVKKRNTEKGDFTVQFEDLSFPLECPYLGIGLDYLGTNPKSDNYPTFDRIDNSKGYVKGNVVVCSWRGNRLKNNSTAEELALLAANLLKLQHNS